jgi:nucleoside-diphosphate-sugar epimerase
VRIFVTGGSGLTGPAVVAELVNARHEVIGLARSDVSAARLNALGAAVHRGSLEDLDSLRTGAEAAEAVVHMAFPNHFSDLEQLKRVDREANETLGAALEGSDRPLVSTSGTLVMPAGRVNTEDDPPDPNSVCQLPDPWRTGQSVFRRARRASVRRKTPPTVHGPGDYGFVSMLVATARQKRLGLHRRRCEPLAGRPSTRTPPACSASPCER